MESPTQQPDLDLHAFAEELLLAAGGQRVEELLPSKEGRKRADIAFESDKVVIEIKSITNDRTADPAVKKAMNDLLVHKGPELGGPIIFGTASVRLDKLPNKLAANAFRLLAQRVQKEVTTANKQLRETIEDLGWDDGQAVLLFIVPPMGIDLHLIGWAVNDATRGGRNSRIDSLMMIECDAPDEQTRNLYITQHSIKGVTIPPWFIRALASTIERMFGSPAREIKNEEEFFSRFESKPKTI